MRPSFTVSSEKIIKICYSFFDLDFYYDYYIHKYINSLVNDMTSAVSTLSAGILRSDTSFSDNFLSGKSRLSLWYINRYFYHFVSPLISKLKPRGFLTRFILLIFFYAMFYSDEAIIGILGTVVFSLMSW